MDVARARTKPKHNGVGSGSERARELEAGKGGMRAMCIYVAVTVDGRRERKRDISSWKGKGS